jgi:hypothetical protein
MGRSRSLTRVASLLKQAGGLAATESRVANSTSVAETFNVAKRSFSNVPAFRSNGFGGQ